MRRATETWHETEDNEYNSFVPITADEADDGDDDDDNGDDDGGGDETIKSQHVCTLHNKHNMSTVGTSYADGGRMWACLIFQ